MQESQNWNYRLVRYFLNNKQLTLLLLAVIIIGGLFSFFSFKVEGFPPVPVPVAVVTTIVPGAGPETIDELVTVPLERALKDVKNLTDISSSSRTSASTIILQFSDGGDTTAAVQEIRTKIESITLPEAAREPEVFVPDTSGAPFIVAVTGKKSLQTLFAESNPFIEEIEKVDGVKAVTELTGIKENIYIDLPGEFQTESVFTQINAASLGFPLGQTVLDNKQVSISSVRQVSSLEDLQNFLVTVPKGEGVEQKKLGEIAQVYSGLDTGNTVNRIGFIDGDIFRIQTAVLYSITLESDADVIATEQKIIDALRRGEERSTEVTAELVFSQAEDSAAQIKEIVAGAVGGKWHIDGPLANVGYAFGAVWLLVLVMLMFLDWRSAIISVVSLPLSFLATFLILKFLGINLNTIVLFSLVLVLGLIVDPAIVVLESIKRFMEVGYKGTSAVLRSISLIGQGVFISVLTSLIVFVPFALVSGTFGEIIKYIPLTVIPALFVSYFIPMIFLTWLAARFLTGGKSKELIDENDPHTLWPVARWFIKANRYILAHRLVSIAVIILGLLIPIAVSAIFIGSGKVKQVQFSSPPDADFLLVTAPLPVNATNSQVVLENAKLEKIVGKFAADITHFFHQSFDQSGGSASLSLFVKLTPGAERDDTSKEIAAQLNQDLRKEFGDLAFAAELGAGPPEESFPINVKIFETDKNKLANASQKIAEELRQYPEITAVRYDAGDGAKDISITLDPSRGGQRGLTSQAFYGQIASSLSERTLFDIAGMSVILRSPADTKPETVEELSKKVVFSPQGPVTVGDVSKVELTNVPSAINRLDGERYAAVSGRVSDTRDIIAVQRNITQWAKDHTGELGLDDKAFEDRAGVNEFEKSFQELFLAIALSILFTYIVFVLFFRSFTQPFIILFAVPLIAVGVFPALVLFANGQLGFLEIIGVIMVIGIVENVGIFLIDFANKKIADGMDKKEAIALASGIRFRPIILTKLTALAGLLPLAIFAPFWRGLAVVVIMGIISSGVLSLFTTPVLYSWFTRRKPTPKTVIS